MPGSTFNRWCCLKPFVPGPKPPSVFGSLICFQLDLFPNLSFFKAEMILLDVQCGPSAEVGD